MKQQTSDRWNECIIAIHDLMAQMTPEEYTEACAKLQEFGRAGQPQPVVVPTGTIGVQTPCYRTAGCWLEEGHAGHCD